MKRQPKFREVKVPAPVLAIVVTPHYGHDGMAPGLSIHVTASMFVIETILTHVAKMQQATAKKEGT
jgi:hypothetical protein